LFSVAGITAPVVSRGRADVMTDMLTGATTGIDLSNVETLRPSKVSPMPTGLLDSLREDEILDLITYMLSRGNRKHAMFKQ
jgi:hypothetical protein